jgi:hypothetical protein
VRYLNLFLFDQTMAGVMRSVGSDMAGGYDKVCAAGRWAFFELENYSALFDQTMAGVIRSVGSDMAGGYDKVCAAGRCPFFSSLQTPCFV